MRPIVSSFSAASSGSASSERDLAAKCASFSIPPCLGIATAVSSTATFSFTMRYHNAFARFEASFFLSVDLASKMKIKAAYKGAYETIRENSRCQRLLFAAVR